jgi:hypothetical protein
MTYKDSIKVGMTQDYSLSTQLTLNQLVVWDSIRALDCDRLHVGSMRYPEAIDCGNNSSIRSHDVSVVEVVMLGCR